MLESILHQINITTSSQKILSLTVWGASFPLRKALSEVTACLKERLHRWQQIEKLCNFPVVNNSGLPSLTATLYSDHSWVVMPRVSVPPYPIAGGVDDLDEDTPPIIPQFSSKAVEDFSTEV